MVTVEFAPSLRRHVECAPQRVHPGSLRTVLDAALARAPGLDGYVFDDQRGVRRHVAVFINQSPIRERRALQQPVHSGDRVLVIQALSGG